MEAQAVQEEAKAQSAMMHSHLLTIPDNHYAVSALDGRLVSTPNRPIRDQDQLALMPEMEKDKMNAMDLLKSEDCLMFPGGRGSGKTNLALWLMLVKRGRKIVCDPKGLDINFWPLGCEVAKTDQGIIRAVKTVHGEIMQRKEDGIIDAEPWYLFLDELYYLVDDMSLDIMDKVFSIITLGREYNVHASFTTSDNGVKSLKIEGRSGLRDGLTWLALHKSRLTGQRKGFLVETELGKREKHPLVLPPQFTPNGKGVEFTGQSDLMEDVAAGLSSNKLIERHFVGTRRSTALSQIKSIRSGELNGYQLGNH